MLRTVIIASVGLIVALMANDVSADAPKVLGVPPTCEASTALFVSCGQTRRCLLVGDNEVDKNLFLFDFDERSNKFVGERLALFDPKLSSALGRAGKLSDIEAMAQLSNGEILVFGSFGRNSYCERKKSRRIFMHAILKGSRLTLGSHPPSRIKKKKKYTCRRLFGYDVSVAPPEVRDVCNAIARTEERADQIWEDPELGEEKSEERKAACSKDPALNIEGAVTFRETNAHGERIWVGLRAPLVNGNAVLLRLNEDRQKLRFDAVAFVDLKGSGIRALSRSPNGEIWGIGGMPADSNEPHSLWYFQPNLLRPGATITPNSMSQALPTSSEGLAIFNDKAIVVIDGAELKGSTSACVDPSKFLVVDIVR